MLRGVQLRELVLAKLAVLGVLDAEQVVARAEHEVACACERHLDLSVRGQRAQVILGRT